MLENKGLNEEPQLVQESSRVRSTNAKAYMFATLSSISIVLIQIVLKRVSRHFIPPLILGVRGSLLFLFNLLYLTYTGSVVHVRDPASTQPPMQSSRPSSRGPSRARSRSSCTWARWSTSRSGSPTPSSTRRPSWPSSWRWPTTGK